MAENKPATVAELELAVAADPDSVELRNNLGAAREDLGDFAGARDEFAKAVNLAPSSAIPHLNLGAALAALGDRDLAIAELRIAATLAPDLAPAWLELGKALQGGGHIEQAYPALARACGLDADDGDAHLRLGWVLLEVGDAPAAVSPLQRASELLADDARATLALGHALLESGKPAAALVPLQRCVALEPANPTALHDLGKALAEIGDIEPALQRLREAIATGADGVVAQAVQSLAVLVPGSANETPASVLAARRAWAKSLPVAKPVASPMVPTGRLRVGYVSSFFQHANWMKPVWALLHAHDRERVELHLFGDNAAEHLDGDYRPHATDVFHDIRHLDNAAAAAHIREADLDLLIDLNGYSQPDRLGILALRPAPRIAEWFNMYATTGLDCVDYLIGDEVVVSPDEEADYVEEIVRVPGSYLTFRVEHAAPDVAPMPFDRTEQFTFGCLASQYKLTDAVLRSWMEILRGAKNSRLLIRNRADHEEVRARLAAVGREYGVAARRFSVLPGADHFEFLATYADIDLALDPFPYNGGTTTTEAIWQGVPVMCFRGDRWASRTSASILSAAGLEDFVAEDRDDYVAKATRYAVDPAARADLRRRRESMRAHLSSSSVCDTAGFAANMEAIYERLCGRGGE